MGRPPVVAFDWLLLRGDYNELSDHVEHSQSELVRDALESLSEEDQDVLMARFYERLSYSQLATRLGKSNKGTAWKIVKTALERLEEELARRGLTY